MESSKNEFESEDQMKEEKAEAKFREEIRQLSHGLSKEDLLDFIYDECSRNPNLLDAFLLRFVTNESQTIPFDYSLMISQASERSETEWGTLDEYHIKEVFEKLNLRALKQFHHKEYLDTFRICETVLQDFPPLRNRIRENLLGVDETIFFSIDVLGKLLDLPDSPEIQSKARKLCIDTLLEGSLVNGTFDEAIWELLYQTNLSQEERAPLMAFIEQSIASIQFAPKDPEWEMTDWLLRMVELLKGDQSIENPLEAMRPYIQYAEIREMFVENAIKDGKYDEARSLIKEGILIAQKGEKTGTVLQWENQLLDLAVLEGDTKEIRTMAGALFLARGKFDFEYYDLLKSTYTPPDWKIKVEELISAIGGGQTSVHFLQADTIATILEREDELERLLTLLRENTGSFDLIKGHYKPLEKDYLVEIIQIFQLSIEGFARNNTGRPSYFKLVQMLRTMSQIEGSAPFIKSTLNSFRQRYARRTALIEILNEEFR